MKSLLYLMLIILFLICIFSCEVMDDDYYLDKIIDLGRPNMTGSERDRYKIVLKHSIRQQGMTPKEYYEFLKAVKNVQ